MGSRFGLDIEPVHDQVAAVQDLYDVMAGGAAILALGAGLRGKLQPTKVGTTFGAGRTALFHSVPPASVSVLVSHAACGGT